MPDALLPRTPPTRWRSEAAATQRDRIVVAAAEAIAARGFAATRVSDVLSGAGVSRRAFYEHFTDLEDCLLATYDRGVGVLVSALGEAFDHKADWTDVLDSLLTTYLETLASEPAFTQLALVEVLGAGPRARERYVEAVDRFHDLLVGVDEMACSQDPRRSPTSPTAITVLAGGLSRLVMVEVLAGRGADLMRMHDDLLALGVAMMSQPSTEESR